MVKGKESMQYLEGRDVGWADGLNVGMVVGDSETLGAVVGDMEGVLVVGIRLGTNDGDGLGLVEGMAVLGLGDGNGVGAKDGAVGDGVFFSEGWLRQTERQTTINQSINQSNKKPTYNHQSD